MRHTIRLSGGIMLALVLLLAHPAFAQDAPMPPLAAVQNGQVWSYGFSDQPQPITADTALDHSNLVWSADGNYLAFVARDPDYTPNLMVYDRTTGSITQAARDIADGFPVTFTDDSRQLVFIQDAPNNGAEPTYQMTVFTYDLGAGTSPVQAGSFSFGVGCGGGSPYPQDWRYTAETEGLGGFHLVLAVTPFGLVHSMDCGGSETGLLNVQSGEDVNLGPLSRATVSADRTKVAGIIDLAGTREHEQLVVVDLQTQTRTTLATVESTDQVTWGAAGANELFYSTRHMTDRTMPFTAAELQTIMSVLGDFTSVNVWEVSLHRFDLATNIDTELYRTDAYAVGRMIPTPDGSALIFSQIPNGEDWFMAIADGSLDMSQPDSYNQSVNFVPVQLFRLPVSGGEVQFLGADLNHAALNPAA